MKRCISALLAVILLLSCVLAGSQTVHASKKDEPTRAIAIVFDNSGSMYEEGKTEWCRATYAMEVFASMLNPGDQLLIYPMCEIEVGGTKYSMKDPFRVTDAAKAHEIRSIYTTFPSGTPIESIDAAAAGIKTVTADKKYLIILTDGTQFTENSVGVGVEQIDKRIVENAGADLDVMYLGIGGGVAMPNTPESENFVKRKAEDSADVLSTLTEMCNKIFGRDSVPSGRITGNTVNVDVSLKKMIVFVQGENITDLEVVDSSGKPAGTKEGSTAVRYAENGAGRYDVIVSDTSLQGMMVTYTGCDADTYTIKYNGTASGGVEVYYEPDVDLSFVFTDAEGNTVDPKALYEGTYTISFGMWDPKQNKLIESDMLGAAHYEGSYTRNGEKEIFISDKNSDQIEVTLEMDDTFEADLMVTYLSGYTIYKTSAEFGWPEGGIKVAPRPVAEGDLVLEITGGEPEKYSLQDLETGAPFYATIKYKGETITGEELSKVRLVPDEAASNAGLTLTYLDDCIEIKLGYKNPDAKKDTQSGPCTVPVVAYYTPPGSEEANVSATFTYDIEDDTFIPRIELIPSEDYIVISKLGEGQIFTVKLTLDGAPLPAEEFANVRDFQVSTGGINFTDYESWAADPQTSSYTFQLLATEGIAEGDYPITVSATYYDHIGNSYPMKESTVMVTLSNLPLWLKWVIGLLILLILFIIIWSILHIRVLPARAGIQNKNFSYDGDDVSNNSQCNAELRGKSLEVKCGHAGQRFGFTLDVDPGKESYLYKRQKKRSALAKSDSFRKTGAVNIQEASISGVQYVYDEEARKLLRADGTNRPFIIRNGAPIVISGTMMDAGKNKGFDVTANLEFKKR